MVSDNETNLSVLNWEWRSFSYVTRYGRVRHSPFKQSKKILQVLLRRSALAQNLACSSTVFQTYINLYLTLGLNNIYMIQHLYWQFSEASLLPFLNLNFVHVR